MAFSKEDNMAWENSEVMRELEKIADEVFEGTPIEAYEPIGEEAWEEEEVLEGPEKCECEPGTATLYDGKVCALCGGIKNEKPFEEEIQAAYSQALIVGLEKIANNFAENSKIQAAYRVEQTISELKDLFKGGTYND